MKSQVFEGDIMMFRIERKSRMMFHMLRMFQIEIQAFVSEPKIRIKRKIQYQDRKDPSIEAAQVAVKGPAAS
jgi:hypothetical protein